MWMMAFAGGLRLEQHLCTSLQGTSLCPRFQSGHLTAKNEIKPFLKPLPGQVQSSSLEIIEGLCREKLNGPAMKMAEGPLHNGLITVENRLTVFWGLIRLPNLLAVKQHIGCRRNVVGAMGKGRISERSEVARAFTAGILMSAARAAGL